MVCDNNGSEYDDSIQLVLDDHWWLTHGHSVAHWPLSDSVHLVCVCDHYQLKYKGSIDHLVSFQATSLPSMASHRMTHAMLCLRFCPRVPVKKDKNKTLFNKKRRAVEPPENDKDELEKDGERLEESLISTLYHYKSTS